MSENVEARYAKLILREKHIKSCAGTAACQTVPDNAKTLIE
jgi:hypothetical protein